MEHPGQNPLQDLFLYTLLVLELYVRYMGDCLDIAQFCEQMPLVFNAVLVIFVLFDFQVIYFLSII